MKFKKGDEVICINRLEQVFEPFKVYTIESIDAFGYGGDGYGIYDEPYYIPFKDEGEWMLYSEFKQRLGLSNPSKPAFDFESFMDWLLEQDTPSELFNLVKWYRRYTKE